MSSDPALLKVGAAAADEYRYGPVPPAVTGDGDTSGDSQREAPEGEAPSPQAQARLEGQALALGPRRQRRLAGPGLHLPPPPQTAEAPFPRARQETGAESCRSGGRRSAPGHLPGAVRSPAG